MLTSEIMAEVMVVFDAILLIIQYSTGAPIPDPSGNTSEGDNFGIVEMEESEA